MFYLISLLLLSTIGGQFLRLPYLQGTGILVGDFILAVVIIYYCFDLMLKKTSITFTKVNLFLIGFIFFTFFSLLINLVFLSNSDFLISFFYWIRFIAYLSLFFIAQTFSQKRIYFFHLTLIIILGLVFLGFLQLKYFPNFEVLRMQEKGWDPHIGRLLSTWFDPNFLGGFLAFGASLMTGVLIVHFNHTQKLNLFFKNKFNLFYLFTLGITLIGILLTYSRSSYLAILFALFLIGLIASRKFLLIAIISTVLAFTFSQRLQTRVIDAYESAQALFNPYSTDTLDATARHRLASWKNGFELFQEKPIIGYGYNTLRSVQAKRGLTEWKSHSAGGFDSSLLTVLVTTGLIGFLIFLSFLFQLQKRLFLNYLKESDLMLQGLSLGCFSGIFALLIHAFFVNSFLFPLIMIFIWFWGGMLIGKNYKV